MVKYFLTLILALQALPLLHAAEVKATLDATHVNVGEAVTLTITINGGQANPPTIPEIANFTVDSIGQNSMTSIINGRVESSQTFRYIVGSHVPGVYTIPALTIAVNGNNFTTQALTLNVIGNGAAAQPQQPVKEEPDRFGTLTVQFAQQKRQYAYIGEIAPVIIRAWVPTDTQMQLRSGLQPKGKGFTLHNVSQHPQQSREIRDGKECVVVTWFAGISATKAGKHPISLSLKAVVAAPDPNKPALRRRNQGIPQQLRGSYVQTEITLKSQDQEIDVRPLPQEGKPDGFTGAVGEFQFDGIDIPQQWNTGEPKSVALRIKGSGNFAMVDAPPLTPDDLWKTYPGQDEFQAGDHASFSGSKLFRYQAIPRKAGTYPVTFTLHYFDPDQGIYQTIQSPTQTITVTGADMTDDEIAANKNNQATEPPDDSSTLAPSRRSNSSSTTLSPWQQQTWYRLLFSLAIILLIIGPIGALLQRHLTNPQRREAIALEKNIAQAKQQVAQAYAARDVTTFLAAARRVLQLHLSSGWKRNSDAITLTDIQQQYPDNSPLVALFREADRASYGKTAEQDDLTSLDRMYQNALNALSKP